MHEEYDPKDWRPNYIYFIENLDTFSVKVGRTEDNPLKRLAYLQCNNSSILDLIGVARGFPPHEREMHRRLRAYKDQGEWFTLPQHVNDFVAALPSGTDILAGADIPTLIPIPNFYLIMLRAGYTYREMASFFGYSPTTICNNIPTQHRPRGTQRLLDIEPTMPIDEFYEKLAKTYDVFSILK